MDVSTGRSGCKRMLRCKSYDATSLPGSTVSPRSDRRNAYFDSHYTATEFTLRAKQARDDFVRARLNGAARRGAALSSLRYELAEINRTGFADGLNRRHYPFAHNPLQHLHHFFFPPPGLSASSTKRTIRERNTRNTRKKDTEHVNTYMRVHARK